MSAGIVIVGAGLAGSLMAARLCEAGHPVTLLEAGSAGPRPDFPHAERDAYTSSGEVDYKLNATRVKAAGGTTNHWGAYTPRFVEADFRSRTVSGVGDDWPIGYAELEPYYSQAEHELGVAGNADNEFAGPRSAPYPMPARPVPPDLRERFARLGISLCSQPAAITTRAWQGRPRRSVYRADEVHLPRALATNRCRLISDATALRLEADATGRISRVIYAGLADRTEKALDGALFILCCGGVETPRLLLLSESGQHPRGLANGSGLVGRNFMDHHRTDVECLFDKPVSLPFERALSFQYNARPVGTQDIGLLMTLKAEPQVTDIIRQYYWGKALRDRMLAEVATELLLSFTIEAIPDAENRVTLDPEQRDAFGNPVPRIHYTLDALAKATLARGRDRLKAIAGGIGAAASQALGEVYLDHHMGTGRMSSDPARGVVDANLIAHGIPNLMIVGSSVFVTGACVNPSLTIAALTLRAFNHVSTVHAA